MIPMGGGKSSDTGFRFRSNVWNRDDSYIPFAPAGVDHFYDIILYNSDTM